MNNLGSSMIFGVMLMVLALITVTIFIPPLKEIMEIGRGNDSLDCENTSISTGIKATCLVFDMYLPYFVGVILFGAGSYMIGKRITEMV